MADVVRGERLPGFLCAAPIVPTWQLLLAAGAAGLAAPPTPAACPCNRPFSPEGHAEKEGDGISRPRMEQGRQAELSHL